MIYQEETGGRFLRFPLFFLFWIWRNGNGGTVPPVSFLLYSGWEEMV